ncbi:hypothetical protein CONCODRAFT_4873 [Conidiobolus coronatus NRRL 28638]|uniref:Uncharacterized protein n=1 Tax=Conidiobolus coronatus (strain ATCC 28846 / CBS 209.66 / NRRL 28638) TaxID=796925 RepID=A0A137PBK2_CONC2|nr:hypothetical protein CONCODRAFT_4873 [Conidiobolus coronatus NRRL 28638]|eukprot:KXN72332.1 hypothetical protein CONCODRAFT_4873 [Conidiobolus coronatus NRRL 28638]
MLYQLLLSLLINAILACNWRLICNFNNSQTRSSIHCYLNGIRELNPEYEECEKFKYLEYYQCAYNIHKLPKDQVEFFSRYDQITLMCKDCEFIKRDSTLKAQYCNKDQLKDFKNYGQCIEDNTGKSEHEVDLMEACTILDCDIGKGVLNYAQCSYECHKDIVSKVINSNEKFSTPTNTTESSIPSTIKSETQETGKSPEPTKKSDSTPNSNTKNSSMSLYNHSNIYLTTIFLPFILL